MRLRMELCVFFFFNDTATTEIYTLSLHDALPISQTQRAEQFGRLVAGFEPQDLLRAARTRLPDLSGLEGEAVLRLIEAFESPEVDRKSTRLNSSHGYISYAVFCLKKKNI